MVRLSVEDKQLLVDLAWEELLPGDPAEVTHFFSFPLNGDGARAANANLKALGYETWLFTETEDDDYWHIAAVKVQSLSEATIARTNVAMEALAEAHGGSYARSDLTRSGRKREDWRMRSSLYQLRASRTS